MDAMQKIFSVLVYVMMIGKKTGNYVDGYRTKVHSKNTMEMGYSYYHDAAQKLGVSWEMIGDGILQLRKADQVFNIWKSWTDFDGEASLKIGGNKPLCYQLLEQSHIPIPEYKVFQRGDFLAAIQYAQGLHKPVVIKPAKDTGDASGVYIKLLKPIEILFALHGASMFSDHVMVEEFVEGTNYRLLFCNGKFLAASSRIPRYIIGDGHHTIKQLVDKENEGRLPIGACYCMHEKERPFRYKIPLDKESLSLIKRGGDTLDTILPEGRKLFLQSICHWLKGGEYIDVTDNISPRIVDICKKAVNIVGIKLAGVDIIATDLSGHPGSFVINEINTTPAILVHYEVMNQNNMRPVAVDILKEMFGLS